jgi:hypothetical protein
MIIFSFVCWALSVLNLMSIVWNIYGHNKLIAIHQKELKAEFDRGVEYGKLNANLEFISTVTKRTIDCCRDIINSSDEFIKDCKHL